MPEVANAIQKRQKKVRCDPYSAKEVFMLTTFAQLLDYDAARSKARKVGEKDDHIKLRAVRSPVTGSYSLSNAKLVVSIVQQAEVEEEQAREIYQALDGHLREELPQLLDLRVPYLDPSFECMVRPLSSNTPLLDVAKGSRSLLFVVQVRLQTHFATDGYNKLGGVQRYFAEGVRDDYASGALDAQVEGALQEMRELSICGLSA